MSPRDGRPAAATRLTRVAWAAGVAVFFRAVWGVQGEGAPAGERASGGAVLVMPFEQTENDAPRAWLGEGVALAVAEALRALGVDALPRAERVEAFEALGLPAGASLSRATVIKVAELVGAGAAVVGSFAAAGDRLTLRARVIDLEAGRQGPEHVESAPLGAFFEATDRLARGLELGARGAADAAERGRVAHPPLEAFEFYVKGLVAETLASQRRFLERALEAAPGYAAARLALWRVHSEHGDHAAALAVVREVAAGAPESREARFAAGLSLVALGRLDEALAAFQALAAERPAAALANNLGVLHLRRGAGAAGGPAAAFFVQAAEAEPGAADYAFNAGYAYAWRRDWVAAREWLREAVRLDPADADAHFVLGVVLEASGARTEGARERELAGRLSARYESAAREGGPPALPRGLERLARHLDPPRARGVAQAILGARQREQDEAARFHLEQARRLVAAGADREAVATLRRAVYLSPYLAEAHLLLGRAYLRAGQVREAVDALTIAVFCQESAETRLALARAHWAANDPVAARAEAERALALDPTSAEVKAFLAEIDKRPVGRP
jgi:tetratricopeptide (TPR) repeat protein